MYVPKRTLTAHVGVTLGRVNGSGQISMVQRANGASSQVNEGVVAVQESV